MTDSQFAIQPPHEVLVEQDGQIVRRQASGRITLDVSFRERALRELKGPALSVFVCISLHVNPDGESWPSLETMIEETGWSKPATISAVRLLEDRGWVEAIRSPGRVTHYRPRAVEYIPDVVEAPGDLSTSFTPSAESDLSTSLTGPTADEPAPTSGGVEPEAIEGDGESTCFTRKAFTRSVVVEDSSSELEDRQTTTLPPEGGCGGERSTVYRLPDLAQSGVDPETARELETRYPERVALWLDVAAWSMHVRDERLGPGFLVRAIREGWRPVHGYLPPEERCPECWLARDAYSAGCKTHEAASRRRYVEGELAEFVEH